MDIVMNDQTIYEKCTATPSDQFAVLDCIATELEYIQRHTNTTPFHDTRRYLLIVSGALVFFMQTGFAMLCAGAVRRKNVQNTMLKNLLDACGTAIAFFCLGYGLAFGGQESDDTETTFVGTENFFNAGAVDRGVWFFQYTVSTSAVTIIAGTLAERCQMTAYLIYSMFLSGFVYPVVAHAIWSRNGFLSPTNADPLYGVGMVDFAGAGVVHLTGGATALYAAYILGPRQGRFNTVHTGDVYEKPNEFKGHSISLQVLGTFCLWFGWIGFNGGSALLTGDGKYVSELAVYAAVNTSLAGATGGITSLIVGSFWEERRTGEHAFRIEYAINGCISGLVASTAGCGVMDNWASFITGIISGFIYILSSTLLVRFKIDDCVDAIPVHMANACWGILAAGLFSRPDLLLKAYGRDEHVGWVYSWVRGSGDAHLLACQLLGIVFVIGWTFATMVPFFLCINHMGLFRAHSATELVGLDVAYHGDKGSEAEEEDDKVRDDYLEAFAQYKATLIKKHGRELESHKTKSCLFDVDAESATGSHSRRSHSTSNTRRSRSQSFSSHSHSQSHSHHSNSSTHSKLAMRRI